MHNRQGRFADQGKAARAGGAFGSIAIGVEPEDADREDEERAGGEQRDGRDATFASARARAHSKANDRELFAGGPSQDTQPCSCPAEASEKNEGAGAEKSAGVGAL